VCFWEHTPADEDHWNRSNAVSLPEAQHHFLQYGAVEQDYVDDVRAPRPDEARDPSWLPWEQDRSRARAVVITSLKRAFTGVQLDGGTTLYAAEMKRYYGMDSPEYDPIRHLQCETWEDIPTAFLETWRPYSYFDAKSTRYHLPAYVSYAVTQGAGGVMVWLTPSKGELADWWQTKFSLIDRAQSAAIVAFLEYTIRFDDPFEWPRARVALAYWKTRT